MYSLVTGSCDSGYAFRRQCTMDFIHTLLVWIHSTNYPHIIVLVADCIFCGERSQRCDTLQTTKLPWKFVLDEDATFWCTEVCSALSQCLFIKGLVNYSSSWSAVDCYANHGGDMIQMTFDKSSSSINWINPYHHLFLKELIRELIEVVVSLWCSVTIDLFHFLEVVTIPKSLHIVVCHKHFLADMSLIELVRHDIWLLCIDFINVFVFFTNNFRVRIELLKIILDRILDVDISFSEHILCAASFHQASKACCIPYTMYDTISAFQELDTSRKELIQFDNSLHIYLLNYLCNTND